MWIARDKSGELNLFEEKPVKDKEIGEWYPLNSYRYSSLSRRLFPDITWSNEEPTEVEIIIKKK